MREKFLELTRQDIFGFVPVLGFEDLPGLTPRNLFDLCDIGVRFGAFGADFVGKPVVLFAHRDLRVEVYNFIGNEFGGVAGMMIARRRPSGLTEEGIFHLTLFNGFQVIWDRGFTVEQVQQLLHEINKISYARGHVVAGRRRVLHYHH